MQADAPAPAHRWLPELTADPESPLPLRLDATLWATLASHIRDSSIGEQAGVLLVRGHHAESPQSLTGEAYMPVPERYVTSREHGLSYDGRFHLRVAEQSAATSMGAILVHAHLSEDPLRPSRTDRRRGAEFLQFMARRHPDLPHGLLVVGDTTVTGIVRLPSGRLPPVRSIAAAGRGLEVLRADASVQDHAADDRQLLAIGEYGQRQLANATIAVIGNSGGGSHVQQQLIHAGVGTVVAVDPEVIDETNLRRVVGARASDVDRTSKPDIAVRLAREVRPTTTVVPVREPFPSRASLASVRSADLIIGCVDAWDVRDALNTFAVVERVPYIDIGATIVAPTSRSGTRIDGQVAVVMPGGPCLRCMLLVTDERVARARAERQGYGSDVPSPQVVSVNGTLASEAVTAAIMLLAGSIDVIAQRRYRYPPGTLTPVRAQRRTECPTCGSAGSGGRSM
ncbi:MAG: HesA/MoeB/ThiF family protein [Actinomycetes bacterium]